MEERCHNKENHNKVHAPSGDVIQAEEDKGGNRQPARRRTRKSEKKDNEAERPGRREEEHHQNQASKQEKAANDALVDWRTKKNKKTQRTISGSSGTQRTNNENGRGVCPPSQQHERCNKQGEGATVEHQSVWNDLVFPDDFTGTITATAAASSGTHARAFTKLKKKRRRSSHRYRLRHQVRNNNSNSSLTPAVSDSYQTEQRESDLLVQVLDLEADVQHSDDIQPQHSDNNCHQDVPNIEMPSMEAQTTVGAFAIRGDQMVLREADASTHVSGEEFSAIDRGHSNQIHHQQCNENRPEVLVQGELAPTAEDRDQLERLRQSLRQHNDIPLVHAEVAIARNEENTLKENCMKNRRNRFLAMGVVAILLVSIAVTVAILLTRSSSQGPAWLPLGQEVVGKAVKDRFGTSVSLSSDGKVMAVGANQRGTGRPGYASVFLLDSSTGSWKAMGQEVVGEANDDRFGRSVSLNGNGTILAVGAHWNDDGETDAGHVRVFRHDIRTSQWVQLGTDIDGEATRDNFGWSVSLSEAGDILAAGSPESENYRGSVRLFQYDRYTDSWIQLGQKVIGQADGDEFGYSVSLSSSGAIVAVGARYNDLGGNYAGQVVVYEYDSSSFSWDPLGSPMNGPDAVGEFGSSVSLDDSGLVVAVGAPGRDHRVFVYAYDRATSTWTQHGEELDSQEPGNRFGGSVSLNGSGNVLGVGSRHHDASGLEDSGQVTVFQYNTSTASWDAIGGRLYGKDADDLFGQSVSLSRDGKVVAVGASGRNFNGIDSAGSASAHTLN